MLGYEFEFLVREGEKALSKETFLAFHKALQADGWTPKYDHETRGLVGSARGDVYVGSDDGVNVMEINLPPTKTVVESDMRMTELLRYLQTTLGKLGCTIIGTSIFPGKFDIYNPKCRTHCEHPNCCNKSFINFVIPQRFHEYHHGFFVIASNHIWLDLPKNDFMRHLRMFNRLSPVLIALFANGPVFNGSGMDVCEGRDVLYDIMLKNTTVPADARIFGMYEKEYATIFDYFDFLMEMPVYLVHRDGVAFKVLDSTMTNQTYLYSDKVPALWGKGGEFEAVPELIDFFELQRDTFPNARLKFFIKEGLSLIQVLDEYKNRDEAAFLGCFEKFCVEIRTIGSQPQGELSVAPAFLLGLQENIEATEKILSAHPYEFWRGFYAGMQKNGMEAVYQSVAVAELAGELLAISQKSLEVRGKGEEVYLKPLEARIAAKENPSQALLKIWKAEGNDGLYRARDYTV
jgi:gamma-glutamylcysteine synthetase